jgi:hypothetical protein
MPSAAPAPAAAHSAQSRPQPAPAPAASARADIHEPAKPQQQPLRSVSLEFTPDGAQDVRLRLSQRGGDVHISLHSTDTALTGRLRDGVQDLAGALNTAGYDADAWNSDGRRRRDPGPDEQPQRQARNTRNDSEDDFSRSLRQTTEENS